MNYNPSKEGGPERMPANAIALAGGAAALNFPFISTGNAQDRLEIRVGIIGCGGRGRGAGGNVLTAAQNVKVVALADAFPEQIEAARKTFKDVTDDHCFSGLDAYQKLCELKDVNYVILAGPPGFRPVHFEAAVAAGKHVFMEKPVATDAPGIRTVLAAGELAKKKGLHVAAGTQRRHQASYIETIKRIQDGAIGELLYLCAYWNGGAIWHRGDKGETELEKQVRNWYHYTWLSGDHIVEQHVHNLDVCNWIMNSHPIRALGLGGRAALGNKSGHIFDHHAVEFEYPNGIRLFSQCRQITGCDHNVSEFVCGTKGKAIPSGTIMPAGGERWRSEAKSSPYVQEHTDLIAAIRGGKPLNEAQNVAYSTMTAIMGREATYSGRIIEWDKLMQSNVSLGPARATDWNTPAPKVSVAIPGQYKLG